MTAGRHLALFGAIGAWAAYSCSAHAAPRVVSADYCADQFVLALAAPENIVALSPDAARDFSYLRNESRAHRRIRPDAEALFDLDPDIILSAWGADAQQLARLDLAVARLPYASSLDDIETVIRTAATALHRQDEGRSMSRAFRARRTILAQRANERSNRPRAIYATPGGVTAGSGTLVDDLMRLAGLENMAGDQAGWPSLPAEALILDPPDLIIAGFFDADGAAADNWSLARHPALARLFADTPTVRLDTDVLACPGWFALDAAEAMADAADALEARP